MKILVTSIIDLKKSLHNSRLHQFLRYLSDKNEITVISINDSWKSKWDEIENYNNSFGNLFDQITLFYLSENGGSPIFQEMLSPFNLKKINKKIQFENYDVHFNYNSLLMGYSIAKYTNSFDIPTIYDIADDLPEMIKTSPQIPYFLRPVGKFYGNYLLNKNIEISKKVTITNPQLAENYGIVESKIEVIPNGVDIDLFRRTNSEKLKENLGLSKSYVIGHIGVLREWIDFKPLFIAIKKIQKDIDIKLLIVGGGKGYHDTIQLAKEHGIFDNTVFTGTVPYNNVPEYICCMDVGLIPFKSDKVSNNSLPLKLFEYMACEIPIISSELLVIRRNLKNDVIFIRNSKDYENSILYLYNNPDVRKKMGLNGRKIVENDYQWRKISENLEDLFKSVSKRR